MAMILITGENFGAVRPVQAIAEGLGYSVLHASTTENIVEDVVLNDVALVVAGESSQPFDAWEVCEILRADPSVPPGLGIVLMHGGDVNARRFEKAGFSGKVAADASSDLWTEEFVRQIRESFDPLARSGFE